MEVLSLFFISFLAGSFVPLGSEAYLIYLIENSPQHFSLFLMMASIGNTLGGMTCYFIARYGGHVLIRKYLKINHTKIDKWGDRISKYPIEVSSLLTWLPFVGEVIAATLGLLSHKWKLIFLGMFLGKFIRYLAILKAFEFVF